MVAPNKLDFINGITRWPLPGRIRLVRNEIVPARPDTTRNFDKTNSDQIVPVHLDIILTDLSPRYRLKRTRIIYDPIHTRLASTRTGTCPIRILDCHSIAIGPQSQVAGERGGSGSNQMFQARRKSGQGTCDRRVEIRVRQRKGRQG